MMDKLIQWALGNRVLAVVAALLLTAFGIHTATRADRKNKLRNSSQGPVCRHDVAYGAPHLRAHGVAPPPCGRPCESASPGAASAAAACPGGVRRARLVR